MLVLSKKSLLFKLCTKVDPWFKHRMDTDTCKIMTCLIQLTLMTAGGLTMIFCLTVPPIIFFCELYLKYQNAGNYSYSKIATLGNNFLVIEGIAILIALLVWGVTSGERAYIEYKTNKKNIECDKKPGVFMQVLIDWKDKVCRKVTII